MRRVVRLALITTLIAVLPAAAASAHARVSPAVSLSGALQYYTLAVPTEKDGATTTRVVLTVPPGFGIDSFAPSPPGWTRHVAQTGSGDSTVITRVTWTGGHTPTGEDSVFGFLAQPASATTYTFGVQQTLSDGSIVNWSGTGSSADPAPTITTTTSFGGGGSPTLAIVALVVGVLALLAAGVALVGRDGRGGRPLA